jgi:hypothetical protein
LAGEIVTTEQRYFGQRFFGAVLSLGILAANAAQAEPNLNAIEVKWLNAAEPVLSFAAEQGLNVDIVVQPTSTASDVPLAMGVKNGRCKLILSMRDNPDAEATLAGVPAADHTVLIEAMVAHELAHCWRFSQGQWNQWPVGFTDAPEVRDSADSQQSMRATQREEAFADLVALAWVGFAHPGDYAQVHAWLEGIRSDQPVADSYHDTRRWLMLAKSAATFSNDKPLFEQAHAVWATGF